MAKWGKNLRVGPGVKLMASRGAKFGIGDRVTLGSGVVLSVGKRASLTVGDDVFIGHYTVIGAEGSLCIQPRAQIAEHCSVRDHDHDSSAISMRRAPVICGSVNVGADAWIGRGVAVLRGADVGAGAVVGANALIRSSIPPDAIALGVPARVVRARR